MKSSRPITVELIFPPKPSLWVRMRQRIPFLRMTADEWYAAGCP